MGAQVIKIKGARQHNLKDLSLEIPRNKLVVITGLSGSGKSSLAFDTLFAEGQRKYVESLSAYARQFLDQLQKPDVDFIEGLSPSIAIEQRSSGANPRSTIATTTEIYDYLRVFYASVGQPHDPATGEPIYKQTPQQIVDKILAYPEGSRIMILAPLVRNQKGEFRDVIEKVRREGFVRVRVDGAVLEVGKPQPVRLDGDRKHSIEAVVDRLVVRDGIRTRLADSVDTALRWGENHLLVLKASEAGRRTGVRAAATASRAAAVVFSGPGSESWDEHRFSTEFCNPETGFALPALTPKHLSFNSHLGACPACHGLGTQLVCDADLMIPDKSKTLADGAVRPWTKAGKRMQHFYDGLLKGLVKAYRVSLDTPYEDLPKRFTEALCFGTGDRAIPVTVGQGSKKSVVSKPFEGLVPQMERLYEQTESETTKNRIRTYMTRQTCSTCRGARLKPEILAVTMRDKRDRQLNIQQFCSLAIDEARRFIDEIKLTEKQRQIAAEVLREIRARLDFLVQVGLGYLSLDRQSGTLSGGEAQRIRLATQIGSGLAGVIYVLDEPSIGLHQKDNDRLIRTLKKLRDLGNSVFVVEHDEDTIRAADHILDLGPGAGPRGGKLVAQGTLDDIIGCEQSLTAQYLAGTLTIPVPKHRTPPRAPGPPAPSLAKSTLDNGWLTVHGAAENNLRNITVSFPLGCLNCVTGVSGSGKSTLVDDILRRALFRHFYRSKDVPGEHRAIYGLDQIDKAIVIDQSPIGRTPRSNPVTYSGAFTPIRDLFSQVPVSRVRGYDAGRFSFNMKGGRCENCKGDGLIKIEMHFLADVYVQCEVCRGRRYNRETLEVTYKGKNIADILDLSVDEAASFFRNVPSVSDKLSALQDVGLGYIRLGQPATELSGGEAQRVKLAAELARKSTGQTVYILDEPTTGLHFADIHKLLEVLIKLRDAGNTLIIIEHNLEVIKCADWLVDLGPDGGDGGGKVVAHGPPETVSANGKSYTGQFLRRML